VPRGPPSSRHGWGCPSRKCCRVSRPSRRTRSDPLDELNAGGDSPLAERIGEVDTELERVEYREVLTPLLDGLSERDRTILMLRFFGNRTQTRIADTVGISQMHVSRVLNQVLAGLRRRMDREH
jgi:RNA polymerase sigma-B factor